MLIEIINNNIITLINNNRNRNLSSNKSKNKLSQTPHSIALLVELHSLLILVMKGVRLKFVLLS